MDKTILGTQDKTQNYSQEANDEQRVGVYKYIFYNNKYNKILIILFW
jgi:hypothetical protein